MLLTWPKDSGTSTPSSAWPWRSESGGGEKCVNGRVLTRTHRVCGCDLLGPKTICLVCLASAGPHTQPSSCPQNWDHWGPRRETAACSLLQYLRGRNRSKLFSTHTQGCCSLLFLNSATRGHQDLLTSCKNSRMDKEGM